MSEDNIILKLYSYWFWTAVTVPVFLSLFLMSANIGADILSYPVFTFLIPLVIVGALAYFYLMEDQLYTNRDTEYALFGVIFLILFTVGSGIAYSMIFTSYSNHFLLSMLTACSVASVLSIGMKLMATRGYNIPRHSILSWEASGLIISILGFLFTGSYLFPSTLGASLIIIGCTFIIISIGDRFNRSVSLYVLYPRPLLKNRMLSNIIFVISVATSRFIISLIMTTFLLSFAFRELLKLR